MGLQTSGLSRYGGVECTINRVGDRYFSQLARNGHPRAVWTTSIGSRTSASGRYVSRSWEELAPRIAGPGNQLAGHRRAARAHARAGYSPDRGLLHHGSGPRYTICSIRIFLRSSRASHGAWPSVNPWIDAYTPSMSR
jgi:dTDP-4-dehydrorhamnose reductase